MEDPAREEITRLLNALPDASPTTHEQAWQVLYREILRVARNQRRRWEGDWTMETRALANEVFLKVFGHAPQEFKDRQHFFRLIAKAIRQILINYAENRRAAKRGGGAHHTSLEDVFDLGFSDGVVDQIWDLHLALEKFEEVDPRAAEVVQLKFFVGLKNEEMAEVLGTSKATVVRDWNVARAWLWRELNGSMSGKEEGGLPL